MSEQQYEKRDIRQEITNGIIEQLEKGVMPWRKNWQNVAPPALPANGESGRAYSGGNRVGLMVAMHERGWEDHRFLTFQQLRKLDAGPGAGERGTPVEYWEKRDFWKRKDCVVLSDGKPVKVLDVAPNMMVSTSDGRTRPSRVLEVKGPDGSLMPWAAADARLSVMIGRHSTVFNVAQCDRLGAWLEANPISREPKEEPELDAELEKILRGMKKDGLTVQDQPQNRAYYSPTLDTVVMPEQRQFESAGAYRSTLLHEIAHATGHPKRLGRELGGGHGSESYAREELVAELSSAFLSAATGIQRVDESHAQYIGSWLKALHGKDGKDELYAAARDANKATDYVLARAQPQREREPEPALER